MKRSFISYLFVSLATILSLPAHARQIEVAAGSCDAINQAIASLTQEGGGTVQLSAGEYQCDTPVVIKTNNIKLFGAGSDQTKLKAADGKPMPVLVIGDTESAPEQTPKWGEQWYPITPVSNIEVGGITFDGNRHSTSFKVQADSECYDFGTMKSLNCNAGANKLVRNNGITIRHASNISVHDVVATANYSGGIVTEKKCTNLVLDNFSTTDSFFDGFAGYETSNSVIRNCRINNNTYSGLSVDLGFEGNRFENCELVNNGDNGVFSANVGSNTYEHVHIAGNHNYAIYIDGTSRKLQDGSWMELPNTCDGNVVTGNSVIEGNGHGIRFNGICKAAQVSQVKFARQAECVTFADGAQVAQDGVQCPSSK